MCSQSCRHRVLSWAAPVFLALGGGMSAQASITLTGTRVIYNEAKGEAMLHLSQDGPAVGMVQLWIDSGDPEATPESVTPPFVITPTIAVIHPGSQQRVRIVRTRNELPADRESVLWLNVMEMSREYVEQTQNPDNSPNLAFRARVKMFYRPEGLSIPVERAPELLQFSFARALPDGRLQIRIYNPSPYHVTFRSMELRQSADAPILAGFTADSPGMRMVAPMSELIITLDGSDANPVALPAQADLSFNIINDYGSLTSGRRTLETAAGNAG